MGGAYQGDVAPNLLFANPSHGNHWITLRLEGVESNRFGVGGRIKVTVETDKGLREIHRVVGTGGSFGSSSLQHEIGLGQATGIREIDVQWPASRKHQTFTDVKMDGIYQVREGEHELVSVEMKTFDFPTYTPITVEKWRQAFKEGKLPRSQ